jgi:hypothetical protein
MHACTQSLSFGAEGRPAGQRQRVRETHAIDALLLNTHAMPCTQLLALLFPYISLELRAAQGCLSCSLPSRPVVAIAVKGSS